MAKKERAVYAALLGNLSIAITKFIAASVTGSSAMISEGFHSLVDTGDGLLLLWGRYRSKRPPDTNHPFGHGQELYFWTLIVALIIFAAGGGLSVYEGVEHLRHPAVMQKAASRWNYAVLAIAAIFEGISFGIGFRQFREEHRHDSLWDAFRSTKDPVLFTVLFEDGVALAGLSVAFVGILLSDLLKTPQFDSLSSVLIGLLLMAAAGVLARESRKLLTGEVAGQELIRSSRSIAEADPTVMKVATPVAVHFGPETILLGVGIQFRPELSAGEVSTSIDRIEKNIRSRHPAVKHIFVEAEKQIPRERTGARSEV